MRGSSGTKEMEKMEENKHRVEPYGVKIKQNENLACP